jgi:hypothetical protein
MKAYVGVEVYMENELIEYHYIIYKNKSFGKEIGRWLRDVSVVLSVTLLARLHAERYMTCIS